jgi:hypothetical protein
MHDLAKSPFEKAHSYELRLQGRFTLYQSALTMMKIYSIIRYQTLLSKTKT